MTFVIINDSSFQTFLEMCHLVGSHQLPQQIPSTQVHRSCVHQ